MNPTPYLWQYQPETGLVAGARQDYGSEINWLGSDLQMFNRVQRLRRLRNQLEEEKGTKAADSSFAAHFNDWTLEDTKGTPYVSMTHPISKTALSDMINSSEGVQMAGRNTPSTLYGGGLPQYSLGDGRQYRKLTRDAMPFPHNWFVKEEGIWKPVPIDPGDFSGGAVNALSSYPNLQYLPPPILRYRRPGQQLQGRGQSLNTPFREEALLTERSRLPVTRGLDPSQFTLSFPPVVYKRPFSSSLSHFPREFSPLYDPNDSFLRSTTAALY